MNTNKIKFDEPVKIDRVWVYGGRNGKKLDIVIPETMTKEVLYSWRERNFNRLYELTKIDV